MLESFEEHAQKLAIARMARYPHSTIKLASNGTFELAFTYQYDLKGK
jgi:hypothetical protein